MDRYSNVGNKQGLQIKTIRVANLGYVDNRKQKSPMYQNNKARENRTH